MIENISDILNELKTGQVIKVEQNEYVFVEPRKKKAVVYKRGESEELFLKGKVEVTEEIDIPTLERLEEEEIGLILKEQEVRKMKRDQIFIGTDDKEYYLVKKTRFGISCVNIETGVKSSIKISFIKKVLQKIYSKN